MVKKIYRPGCNGNNILAGQLYSVTVNVYFQGFFRIGIIIVSIKVLIVENVFQAKKRKAYGVMNDDQIYIYNMYIIYIFIYIKEKVFGILTRFFDY